MNAPERINLEPRVVRGLSKSKVSAGDVFGRLTAVEYSGVDAQNRPMVLCRCECGATKAVMVYSLTSGSVKSCGCLQRETAASIKKKHGKSNTREHNIWQLMLQRCKNPSASHYERYGGRGITVCDEWASFENFLADMGPCPRGFSIDRVDNEKGYSKDNCRWATRNDQMRNTSRTILLTLELEGVTQTLCLKDWSAKFGIPYPTVRKRIRSGMSPKDALQKRPYKS